MGHPTATCSARATGCSSFAPTPRKAVGAALRRRVQVFAKAAGGNGNGSQGKKTTVHKLIEEHGSLLVPGCYDALSAKLLQRAGHKAAFISGYAVSATLLGEPDLGLLTSPEVARKAGQICNSAPGLPVLADCDSGGGNVLNVKRTVKQLIASGAKGCFIEDQQWPKRAGMRNKEVISMEEFAAKIYAAREAIGDADFFLVARTDARGTSAKYGLEDAITRVNLYAEAGADATFVEAPRSVEEMKEIAGRTKGLRVANMMEGGLTPLLPQAELAALGFQIVIHPLSGLFAATRALIGVYGDLATEGTTRAHLASLSDLSEFNDLIGYESRVADEERLTRGEVGEKLKVRVRAAVKPVQP